MADHLNYQQQRAMLFARSNERSGTDREGEPSRSVEVLAYPVPSVLGAPVASINATAVKSMEVTPTSIVEPAPYPAIHSSPHDIERGSDDPLHGDVPHNFTRYPGIQRREHFWVRLFRIPPVERKPSFWINFLISSLLCVITWTGCLVAFFLVVIFDKEGNVKPFQVMCVTTTDSFNHLCFFSAGFIGCGIISLGVLSIGAITLGQVTLGALFAVGQVAGGCGISIGQLTCGWYVYLSQVGFGLYYVQRAQVGFQSIVCWFPNLLGRMTEEEKEAFLKKEEPIKVNACD